MAQSSCIQPDLLETANETGEIPQIEPETRNVLLSNSEASDLSDLRQTLMSSSVSLDSLFTDVEIFDAESGYEDTPSPIPSESLITLLNQLSEQERLFQIHANSYPGDLPKYWAMCVIVLSLTLGLMGLLLILSVLGLPSDAKEPFVTDLSNTYSLFNGSDIKWRYD